MCSNCYEDVDHFNKFISKVTKHQNTTSNNILKSILPKGISIKKIQSGYKEPLFEPEFEAVQVKSEPMEMETCLVKCEPVENLLLEEASYHGTSDEVASDDDFYDDDEDFNPPNQSEKASNISAMKKVADFNFTCANCKISYDDFDTLTKHITSRVCIILMRIK